MDKALAHMRCKEELSRREQNKFIRLNINFI